MSILKKPIIGITTGDLNGVGIEIAVKTFADSRLLEFCIPVIFASSKVVNFYKNILKETTLQFAVTKDLTKLSQKQVNIFACWDEDVKVEPGEITNDGGKYAIRSLMVATQCLKDGEIDGLITNPIHKQNAQTPDFKHTGHTPFLKEKFAAKDVAMMLCTEELRVSLVTEHVSIADVSKNITIDKIVSKAQLIQQSLIKDFGIDKPKIAILALNPHAGDNGLVGKEEQEIIVPAIEKLNQLKVLAFGPYSADGFFARGLEKNVDCVLAMYHDQGLIPFKALDREMGVNYTAGLPIVRTSPDHGTAFDIAGKGIASNTSFLHALYMCIDIIAQRAGYIENTKNKLQKHKLGKMRKSKEDVEE
jgi:4-hydroxythreonine-4-phosphate dehydrogenase